MSVYDSSRVGSNSAGHSAAASSSISSIKRHHSSAISSSLATAAAATVAASQTSVECTDAVDRSSSDEAERAGADGSTCGRCMGGSGLRW